MGDGVFRSIQAINSGSPSPHLTAAGVRHGKPLVGYIVNGDLTEIEFRSDGAREDGLRAMTNNGVEYVATDATEPSSGRAARMWMGDSLPSEPGYLPTTTEQAPLVTSSGQRPVWLAPHFSSEDFGVVGVVRREDRWRVHGWGVILTMIQLDDERSPLYLRTAPSAGGPLTDITQGSLIAAGDMTDDETDDSLAPTAWTLAIGDGIERTGRWEVHALNPVPDGLTDISTWELGWLLAGHKDLAPIVYDFDDGHGEAIDMPSTRLDPKNPGVFLVLEVDAPPVLATQSVDGSKVWFSIDGHWRHIAAPAGRLQALEFAGDELYLLIDGSIWHTGAPEKLLEARAEG